LIGSSGFDRVARVNPNFKKKLKRHCFSKKKTKINGLQPDFVGSTRRVTPGHDFFYFFFNPAWFQPRVGRVLD
jgi:hypothetical protein